jgi:large subunit ribosomal protein L25
MGQIELQATKRETLGKKVRFLRRRGIIPTHLFGHGIESIALQCDAAQLQQVLAQTGMTRLLSLKLEKAKKPRNVVVREVQKDPQTGELLHVDFYQVRMAEKIKVDVPIIFIGEAPALKSKENRLLHELTSLTIECLPDKLPDNIELDMSPLTEAGKTIQVKDISLGKEITVFNDPEHIVVKITLRPIEKVEEVEVVEEVAEEVAAGETGEVPEVASSPTEETKE